MQVADMTIHFAEVRDDKCWYQYLNGYFIFKKPLTARYSCSVDVMIMIAEKMERERLSQHKISWETVEDFTMFDRPLTEEEVQLLTRKEWEMKPKFKVGQTVQMIASPHIRVFILETLQQTCYAGVSQNWYHGRVCYQDRFSVAGKIEKFSEIELVEVPTASVKLKKLLSDWKALKAKKEGYIQNQDFEKAAALREEERTLQDKIRLCSEAENIAVPELRGRYA